MKISAFQAIFIGIFGLAAVIGLFVFATYTNNGGKDAIGTVLIWGTLPQEEIDATLRVASQTEAGLKSVTYEEKNPATFVTDLSAAIATGVAPDLVLAPQEDLFAMARFITPITSDMVSARDFTDNFIGGAQIFTAPTGYYGIPFLVDPLVLFSNRSILSSNGIPRPPETWEALTGLVPRVAMLTPSRQITRGLIALGSYTNVHNARGILSTLFLQAGVPLSSVSSTGGVLANLGMSAANGSQPGQAVLSFYTQFADPSKVSYTWNASLPDSQRSFSVGDLVLYLGYGSEARFLRAANPNLNFAVSPVPQPATAAVKNTYGLIYALMVPRGAKNPNGAYQAAVLLSHPATQALAAGNTGLAPANVNALSAVPADPAAAVSYSEALYTSGWLSPTPADTDSIFSGMIGSVITGRSTLEVALGNAERALSALLQR